MLSFFILLQPEPSIIEKLEQANQFF